MEKGDNNSGSQSEREGLGLSDIVVGMCATAPTRNHRNHPQYALSSRLSISAFLYSPRQLVKSKGWKRLGIQPYKLCCILMMM